MPVSDGAGRQQREAVCRLLTLRARREVPVGGQGSRQTVEASPGEGRRDDGGLGSAILLIALSPVVSGGEKSMIQGADFSVFPLSNPGIVSIPLAFFLGWLGTVTSKEPESIERYDELEVRSLTGAGSEGAVIH